VRESERELEFYLAYRNYMGPIRAMGLRFCLPKVSASSKSVLARSTYDLALAAKLISGAQGPVVANDFELSGPERIIVVSGPNQGGKTTFARTFGQLHHLASIGVPVPGTEATLAIFDQIFTHFEREEDLVRLSGKLEDDLVRIHDILSRATPQSIVILNEIFTSTALSDARYLGTKIMQRIIALDLFCVFVTFVDEMASMGDSVVSMMSTVVPTNPAERTFKVVRAPADGLAHAWALAEKHHLTYEQIKERLAP
jgi:DNA mismatch repair ATPase MutS